MQSLAKFFFEGLGRRAAWATLGLFLAAQLLAPSLFDTPRLALFDLYQQHAPHLEHSSPVVIVELNDESIKAHGQWPWPRHLTAQLVAKILHDRPLVLGLDMIMPEADRSSPQEWLRAMPGVRPELHKEVNALANNDEVFAREIAAGPVVLGIAGIRQSQQVQQPLGDVGRLAPFRLISIAESTAPPSMLPRFDSAMRSVKRLDAAATGHGVLSVDLDRDGVVRRLPLVSIIGNRLAPSFALEVLRVTAQTPFINLYASGAATVGVGVGPLKIPTQEDGSLWVHYSPQDPRRFLSAHDVLAGRVSGGTFTQRIVLIAVTGLGLGDVRPTPVGYMHGTEIWAQLLENIHDGRIVTRPSWTQFAEPALTLLLGLFFIATVPLARAFRQALLVLVVLIALAALGGAFWMNELMLVDVATPAIGGALTFVSLLAGGLAEAEAAKRRIRDAFAHYLSPEIVETLARDPSQLKLGGDTRELTIMFCDIRGFTPIAENFRDNPQELTQLISRTLTTLSREVLNQGGTIDKYIGDCVMAFWNAPIAVADHARRACECALAMIDALTVLNRELTAHTTRKLDPIEVTIGINTGVCVVGNVGSELRFDYSALGDAVNVSSRLQTSAANYGFPIVTSEHTQALVHEKFAFIEIDYVAVKGHTAPTRIYALLGRAEMRETPEFKALQSAMQTLINAFRARNWPEAREAIAAGRNVQGAPAAMFDTYAGRIAYHELDPPPEGWDGAWSVAGKLV